MGKSILTNRLKTLRSELKLTQGEIAEKLNIALTTYANWEQGTRTPDYTILVRLSDLYSCSIDYLIGRTNNRNEVLNPPDEYQALIVKAKDSEIPAKVLTEYIDFLNNSLKKKS
jgi:transcriptional regulator with XRE-family HTH domain